MIESKNKQEFDLLDIQNRITPSSALGLALKEDLLSEEDLKLLKDAFNIIGKYTNSNWLVNYRTQEMQADVVTLQALQTLISYSTASIIGYASNIEEQLKVARAKVRLQVKKIKLDLEKQGNLTKLTADETKDICYVETETLFIELNRYAQTSELLKFTYYAIKDHVNLLEKAISRIHRIDGMES